ncbi:MAG TPA: GNAT family N-acetyltransferase, partial [Fimbriimonas sp.]
MFASVVPERIVGERVELVRHRLDLARAAAEAIDESIEHLRPWQPWIAKYEGVQSCIQYAEWVAPQWGRRFDYQILRRTDRCFLGQANLESFNREVPSIMIGYWLRRSATGHGYATETAKLLRDMAFETLKVVRLELLCDV